jgi:tRNA-specific 2-thiouridylase
MLLVKFKLFLETALEDGADLIATGHYARTKDGQLLMAKDANKDQTYFLYRVTKDALQKTLFPIGDYSKPEIRELAKNFGLVTATKKESMGICFVGKVGIKDFLIHELGLQKAGSIVDQAGVVVGKHEGAIFYTIGQRHGLQVGGGLPYYVIGKDMKKNEVYVTTDLDDKNLWTKQLVLGGVHWINESPTVGGVYLVRTRHRAPLVTAHVVKIDKTNTTLELKDEIRAATPGQSVVLYDKDIVVGGGIIVAQ